MNLEEFAQSDKSLRSVHIREPGITIYIRKPTGFTHNADFELSTLSADRPGRGALTKFMDKYGDKYTFYVENILETRLVGFFERRGLRVIGNREGNYDLCMISADCHHFKDDLQASPQFGAGP